MSKKNKEESELKKMDRFQKVIVELEKFQVRLDDTDNPMNTETIMAYLGHINYVIINLAEEMSGIKQRVVRILGIDKEGDTEKEVNEKMRYFI